jgi:uncharacterized protein (DUF1501 family)
MIMQRPLTRRQALRTAGTGFGMLAFSAMAASIARAATAQNSGSPGALTQLHYKPLAKQVIFLFMNGGCSSIDCFDYKPALEKYDGKPLPGGETKTERKTGNLMKSPFQWKQYGQTGKWMSEIWPNLSRHVDEMCFIHSMTTDIPNHEPALFLMHTGHNQAGRPGMGAWLTYGLGTMNSSLPGYVVLAPNQNVDVGPPLWSNGFLPPMHQGTYISSKVEKTFDPKKLIPYISSDRSQPAEQRLELDLLEKLNAKHIAETKEPQHALESSIMSMETAYRMQTEAPDVFDISKESEATQKLYGPGSTARGCLMAARLIERGVRMVHVYHDIFDPWDAHDNILRHRKSALDTDQPYAALLQDLKGRGLWDDTLVICGSEFGRTPVVETSNNGTGRDHNPFGFTMWLAGGAVKNGFSYGATDDFGFKAVENPTHVHDLHATALRILGIDHTKLTYNYSGRDFRLTDVYGKLVPGILSRDA